MVFDFLPHGSENTFPALLLKRKDIRTMQSISEPYGENLKTIKISPFNYICKIKSVTWPYLENRARYRKILEIFF